MRARSLAAGIAAALTISGSALVATPTASAATGGVFCFKQPGGHAWDQPVYVQVNNANTNTGWETVAETTPDQNGCAVFALSGPYVDMYVRGFAVYSLPGTVETQWMGVTPNVGTPGEGYVDLGVGIVYCTNINPSATAPCPAGTERR